jgi:hypothetical protein
MFRVVLDRSTPSHPKAVHYVKSFSLSVSQLRDVIADFHENRLYYPKAAVWANMTETVHFTDIIISNTSAAPTENLHFDGIWRIC